MSETNSSFDGEPPTSELRQRGGASRQRVSHQHVTTASVDVSGVVASGDARLSKAHRRHSPHRYPSPLLAERQVGSPASGFLPVLAESARRRQSPSKDEVPIVDVVRELHHRMPMLYWLLWALGNSMIHADAAVVDRMHAKLRRAAGSPEITTVARGRRVWPLRLWQVVLYVLVPCNLLQFGLLLWEVSAVYRKHWRLDGIAFAGLAIVFGIGLPMLWRIDRRYTMHVLDLLDDVEANFSHHVTKLTNLNDDQEQDQNQEENEEEEDCFASKPSSRGQSSRSSLARLRESIREGWRFFFEFSVDDTTPHGALLYRRALTFLCLLVTVTMGTHQAFDLLSSREFQVTAQHGYESYAGTPGLTVFDLRHSTTMQQFAPPVPSTDGTTGIQGEQLDFTAVQFVEAQMREWISLKSTLVALLQWSVRFRLGVGALWLSSIVAGMWAAVLAQSIFLNIVNIKCATLIRSAQIIQPNFRTVIRPSGLTQVLGPLSNIGICMYMAWISTKSSTAQVTLARFLYAKNRLESTIEHTGWCWSVALFGAPLTLFFNFCSTWLTIRIAHEQTGSWVDALGALESWRAIFVFSFLSLNLAQLYPLGYLTTRYSNLSRYATRKIVPPHLPTTQFQSFVQSLYLLRTEGVCIQPGIVMTPNFSLKFFAVYNLLARFIAEKMLQA